MASLQSTTPVRRAHVLDVAALETYLKQHLTGFAGPLTLEQFSFGQSNPTYLLSTPERKFVLRKKPPGAKSKGAHAVEREYRVTSLFSPLTGWLLRVAWVILRCCSDPSGVASHNSPRAEGVPAVHRRFGDWYTVFRDGICARAHICGPIHAIRDTGASPRVFVGRYSRPGRHSRRGFCRCWFV
jgi:hypothetical protein